jgi:hypothetical protein
MERVTRRVNDPFLIARFAEFKKLKRTLPAEQRLCSKHNEAVVANEIPFDNHGATTPNLEIVFSGCCEDAIRQEFEFMDKTLAEPKRSSDIT